MRPKQPEKLIDPETGEFYTETLSSNFEVKILEYRNKWGQLHREGDRPAKIVYKRTPEGEFYKDQEYWFINGLRHRETGPACICYWISGNPSDEEWWLNDTLTRLDKTQPTHIEYYEKGEISIKRWRYPEFCKNNNADHDLHRENGPAVIVYRKDQTIREEIWMEFGKTHRIGAPYVIEYDAINTLKVIHHEWEDLTKEKPQTPLYDRAVLQKGVNLLGQIGFQKIGHHWALLNAALNKINLK